MANPKFIHNVTKQELPSDTTGWEFVLIAQPVKRNNLPNKFLDGMSLETSIYVKGDPTNLEKYAHKLTEAILDGIKEKYGNDKAKETS